MRRIYILGKKLCVYVCMRVHKSWKNEISFNWYDLELSLNFLCPHILFLKSIESETYAVTINSQGFNFLDQ